MYQPASITVLVLMLSSTLAAAQQAAVETALPEPRPEKLGVFVGMGYLGSPGAHGSAINAGVRLSLAKHFAASFDLGYGLVTARPIVHDRWWLIPSVELVIPAGPVRFDLGAGLGLGTSSGYTSMEHFTSDPFMPSWAFQLVPTGRVHAVVSTALSRKVDLFFRAEVASLLLDGNSIGFRDGNPNPGLIDTMWVNLWLGVKLGVL